MNRREFLWVAASGSAAVSLMPAAGRTVAAPSQEPELIVAEYLASQFTAAIDAPSKVTVASTDEPGERLVVTGRTLDEGKAVPGVSIYVFHTDSRGRYALDMTDPNAGELNPRLHAALRTDSRGMYEYDTIRPGSYDNGPAHVHYVVKAAGYKSMLLSLQFDDDPIVVGRRKFGIPLLDPESFKSGPCKSRPDCVLTRPVTRDPQGISRVTRDIQMVPDAR